MKIVIGVPSGGMWHAEFGLCLFGLRNNLPDTYETLMAGCQSSFITMNRNRIVRVAMQAQADYLLFLDTDMVFPPYTLSQLLSHEKDIVGATYRKRVPPHTLLGYIKDAENQPREPGELWEMTGMPGGCLLIKMDVFNHITKPWFRESYKDNDDQQGTEDYYFSDAARAAGYQIWCDSKLTADLGHIGAMLVTEKRSLNGEWEAPAWVTDNSSAHTP